MKRRLLASTLILMLTLSIGCAGKRPITTDPTQPPGLSLAAIMEREAARAERIAGYAELAINKALPVFAGAVKLSEERFNRDKAFLVGLRDKATALAPILRGIGNATLVDGKDKAKAIVDEMLALVEGLEQSGLHLFPDSEAGQRLESAVRVALAILPAAVRTIKGALSR